MPVSIFDRMFSWFSQHIPIIGVALAVVFVFGAICIGLAVLAMRNRRGNSAASSAYPPIDITNSTPGFGTSFPSPGPDVQLEEGVRQHLNAGRKIMAIKLYRERTGCGLAEAKYAVEEIERQNLHS
ncbi:MAG: hypothetical protein ACAI35_16635 [Candidatus Methylacidiphilales bacterium]|nr:hypothetical protein [Candidatus Methylacidiphilales bacterium]